MLATIFIMSNISESYNLNISLINMDVSSFKIKNNISAVFDILYVKVNMINC
jgi:hypothetical protein